MVHYQDPSPEDRTHDALGPLLLLRESQSRASLPNSHSVASSQQFEISHDGTTYTIETSKQTNKKNKGFVVVFCFVAFFFFPESWFTSAPLLGV